MKKCKCRLPPYITGLLILVCVVCLLVTNPWISNGTIDDAYNLPAAVSRNRDVNGVFKEDTLYALSRREVSRIYHDYVNTAQVKCYDMIRAGKPDDGGWDVCVDPAFRPRPPCIVYSFGIQNDFSFDDDMAEKYGCEVHSYDPSMNVEDHLRGRRVHFHKSGLSSDNTVDSNKWQMKTFGTILKENNHTGAVIDVLKFDIENSELVAIPEMLKSGSLKNVKQLLFEMHIKRGYQEEPNKEKYIFGLSLFLGLYKEGFRIFNSHRNMYPKYISVYGMTRTGCHEIYMIREPNR